MEIYGIEGSNQEIIKNGLTLGCEILMDTRRPSNLHTAKSNGDGTGFWHDESPTKSEVLTAALNEKHLEIDTAMSETVRSEFQCSALGSIHSYDCREFDQVNIAQALRIAEESGVADYLAKPSGGFFQMIQHSLDELKSVDAYMFAHVSLNRSIARGKKSEAITAHESGDVDAIKSVSVLPWS